MIIEPLGENVQDLQSCIIESLEARKAQRQTISDLQSTVNKLEGDSMRLAALKVEHSIAMAALDKSQAHNARIKDGTELANYEAFIAAFKMFLGTHQMNEEDGTDYWVISPTEHGTYQEVNEMFFALKAQHIGSDEVTEVE